MVKDYLTKHNIQLNTITSTSWWLSTSLANEMSNTNKSKFNSLKVNCQLYLQTQLDLTDIINVNSKTSQCELPMLRAKRGNELIRKMCECAQEIRNNIGKKTIINING